MGTRLISNRRTSDECPSWLDSSVGQSVASKLQGGLGHHFESRSNLELLMIVKSLLGSFLLLYVFFLIFSNCFFVTTLLQEKVQQKSKKLKISDKRRKENGIKDSLHEERVTLRKRRGYYVRIFLLNNSDNISSYLTNDSFVRESLLRNENICG